MSILLSHIAGNARGTARTKVAAKSSPNLQPTVKMSCGDGAKRRREQFSSNLLRSGTYKKMNATLSTKHMPPSARPQEHEWTDEELLLRYRATGDRELFALLVRRYEAELYNYLRRYLADAEMAEDVF